MNTRLTKEYSLKATHFLLRKFNQAPEQRAARRIRKQIAKLQLASSDPKVLFLTPRSWSVHVQWEAMMAQALRIRGASVSFATCGGGLAVCDRNNYHESPPMPCSSCSHYVKSSLDAHGFDQQELNGLWSPDLSLNDWTELDALTLDQLLSLEWNGLALGRAILTPLRWFLIRANLEEEPLAPQFARQFLISARKIAVGFDRLIDRVEPDLVVLLNGMFLFESVARLICEKKHLRTVTYERAFIKDTLFINNYSDDLLDIEPYWLQFREVDLSLAERSKLRSYLNNRRHGKDTVDEYWKHRGSLELRSKAKLKRVSLFTNVTWDSAVLDKEIAFTNIQEWVSEAIEYFSKHQDVQFVIRIHPAEVKLRGWESREPLLEFIEERFPELSENIEVIPPDSAADSYELIDSSDVVLVYTSTVGLEAASVGKPVVVCADAHYRGRGFTIDIESRDEFAKKLDEVIHDPASFRPNIDIAERYAFCFFFRAPVPFLAVDEHVHGLCKITTRNASELLPGNDSQLDRLVSLLLSSTVSQSEKLT